MRAESDTFFRELLAAPGPSGDERQAAEVWRRYASGFADVRGDALGSCYATVNAGGERSVAVLGHIDEIGLVITHIDDEGFLWFRGVGGWVADFSHGSIDAYWAKTWLKSGTRSLITGRCGSG